MEVFITFERRHRFLRGPKKTRLSRTEALKPAFNWVVNWFFGGQSPNHIGLVVIFVLDVLRKGMVQDGHLRPVGVARVGLIRHPGIAQTTRPRNQLNSASCSTDQPTGEERR
jgi:hypothetical protein